ncbi:PAS domain S-box protein [Dawidia soli]|uniref:histidine kinase n=1 Tax=Dawidia soli TaxID=2782352 RepID=A0AAP2GKD8_9BACT|nr:PAS domain S-box protein [Dawidia soli]MBT1690351.1 PAS domain S-box protein [Dawidia soli]
MKLEKWSRLIVVVIGVISVLVLAGWELDAEWLKRPVTGTAGMNPLTALCFALTSLALWLRTPERSPRVRRTAAIAIGIVGILCAYRLAGIFMDLHAEIDEVLYRKKLALDMAAQRFSRMSLNATINFMLAGSAFFLVYSRRYHRIVIAQLSAAVIALLALFALLGYLYRVPEFDHSIPYLPMAVHTAGCFLLLACALLFANPRRGLMRQLTSRYAGSLIAKVLIPLLVLLPIAIGYIRLRWHWHGTVSVELGVALIVISFMLIFILLILYNTNSLNRRDARQKADAWRLQFYNEQLQAANFESAATNEELSATMEELATTNEELVTSNENLSILNDKLERAKETIRQQAEEIIRQKDDQLSEYRKNLDIIFTNTQEGILLLNAAGEVVLFNKTFDTFIRDNAGIIPKAGMPFLEVVMRARREVAHALFANAVAGETSQVEAHIDAPSGPLVHLLRYEPVWQFGRVTHVIIISSDITDKKAQESRIQQSEANLKAIFDNTPDAFVLLDQHLRVIAFNEAYSRNALNLNGKRIEIGEDIRAYVRNERISIFEKMIAEARRGETIQYEAPLREDANPVWFRIVITRVNNTDGGLRGYCLSAREITQQKEYENNLTTIAKELSGLIDNSNVPIFGLDRDGYVNEWNQVTSQVTQYSKQEAMGHPWVTDFIEPPYRESVREVLKRVIAGDAINNFELPIQTRTGERIMLLLAASPRYDAENRIKGVIMVAQNITELIDYRKGLERMVQERTRELNEALQKEKELVDLKSKFVSMASHEFRTPLSTISLATGFIRRYKERISGEEIDRKLDNIVRQIEHMNYLLEDVLTVGKTEAGKVNVNVQVVEVTPYFEVLAREVYLSSDKTHRIRLTIHCDRTVMATDPRMLRIIVVNLLTNAIKFSPGQPSVDLRVTDTNRTLRVEVSDTGIGIPDADRENLFNSFHRGSNTGAIQGTGLGLSIVRKTVDLLGGSIHVESAVNQGTTFIIAIPLHESKDDIGH